MAQLLEVLLISLSVFVSIALVLIFLPAAKQGDVSQTPAGQDFARFAGSRRFAPPAPATHYPTRDGGERLLRRYGEGEHCLILLHGSGGESAYLAGLAGELAEATGLSVLTPDLYGHGPEPVVRGDVDSLERQTNDIADLIAHWRATHPSAKVFIGGHSIGGGTALRFATTAGAPAFQGLLLFSPFIHRKSPAARADSGGWAKPNIKRFAGIEMLQRLGIHVFDRLPVLSFAIGNTPAQHATPQYSWRLYRSLTPRDTWQADIASIRQPTLVLGAGADVIFNADAYAGIFAESHDAQVQVFADVGHFDLIFHEPAAQAASAWLADKLA